MRLHQLPALLLLAFYTTCCIATSVAEDRPSAPDDIGSRRGVPDAIIMNMRSLSRIASYHLKLVGTTTARMSGKIVAKNRRDFEREIWRSGVQRREITRAFLEYTTEGIQVVKSPHGAVTEWSVDQTHSSHLNGWDSKHPYPLPLEFGQDVRQFGSVRGDIGIRHPKLNPAISEYSGLLWGFSSGLDLAAMSEICQVHEIPSVDESTTRLRFTSIAEPDLVEFEGSIVDVDHRHSDMIRRIEIPGDASHTLHEVLKFEEAQGGIWVASKTQTTITVPSQDAQIHTVCDVEICDINPELDSSVLNIKFPEGAKVIEGPELKIHIWGKDGPLDTFTTDEAYRAYVYARARDIQRNSGKSAGEPHGAGGTWKMVMIVGNIVGLGAFAGLTALRRSFRRSPAKTA